MAFGRLQVSEHDEQVAVVQWCRANGIEVVAIPNGGYRHAKTAADLKAEGVSAGFPDLFFPEPRGCWHGMFIEMKDVNGMPPRKSQVEWLRKLARFGYRAGWAKGYEEAVKMIGEYFDA